MPVDVATCPLCGSSQREPFDTRITHGITVNNHLCSRCGLVYQSPRMSDGELTEFYAGTYRQLYQGISEPNQKDLIIQTRRADRLYNLVSSWYLQHQQQQAISRFLDIGCSTGILLSKFQKEFSCQSVGIEPGVAYRDFALSYSGSYSSSYSGSPENSADRFPIYETLDELREHLDDKPEISGPDNSGFDFISMIHVLEHIAEPVNYLKSLREQILSDRGYILIEVPNLYGHDCFEVAHLVSYSTHTLQQTLFIAGFDVNLVQVHGQPRSDILPLYITILAQSNLWKQDNPGRTTDLTPEMVYPARVIPEKRVKMRRSTAMLRRRLLTRLSPHKAWIPIQ